MAQFNLSLPQEILDDIQKIERDTEKIFGGMTKAGAEVVLNNVVNVVPPSWRDSDIMNCIKISKVYKTPSDGGINTKVMISGYFYNEKGILTPAPLVANVFEYGSSKFMKKPFFRKCFKAAMIEQAMMQAQKELSGGLLDE